MIMIKNIYLRGLQPMAHRPHSLPMYSVWPMYDFYNTVSTQMMKNSYLLSENTFS
jgi:hypothetical protein